MAGFVAVGLFKGDQPIIHVSELTEGSGRFLVAVRLPTAFANGPIPGAANIPVEELRGRLNEIPRDVPVVTCCQVGQRGYLSTRVLLQKAYRLPT